MDSKEIVRRLIAGSAEIDRMRGEIDSVVSTVLGLVVKRESFLAFENPSAPKPFNKPFFQEVFYASGCDWRIMGERKLGMRHFEAEARWFDWRIDCCLNIGFGMAQAYVRTYPSSKDSVACRLHDVQRVHESLPVFIEGMAKTFPFLEDSWQPFLDAAGKADTPR